MVPFIARIAANHEPFSGKEKKKKREKKVSKEEEREISISHAEREYAFGVYVIFRQDREL